MKPFALASVVLSLGAVVACALEEAPPTTNNFGTSGSGGSGNAAGMGGSAMAGTGGTVGAGTGGTVGAGTGGAIGAGTGGAIGAGTGGAVTAGTAGAGNMGGMAGGAGMAGAGNAGGMSGAGNEGGMAGAGNMGGMAGAGNASGMAGGGGVAGEVMLPSCPTVTELVGNLDGRLITMPCGDNPNSDDCSGSGWDYNGQHTGCMNGRLDADQTFQINGTVGETYQVTMHFYGVMEPKNYGTSGVTREAGNTRPQNLDDGATPVPWATGTPGQQYRASDYNTYEVHVLDDQDDEVAVYFINSDTQEGHWTYAIDYEKTIAVPGGGAIRLRTFDQNCRQIKNCGTGSSGGAQCASLARTIDTSGAMPAPSGLMQPGLGEAAQHSGQWFLLDVTNVACE